MKKFTLKLLIFNILFIILTINVYGNSKEEVTFNRCVDGDTAIFLINEVKTKVRFLAIDTPETVHPTKSVEAYGKNASEYTCNKITNAKKIELEYDNGSTKLDKYGRTLAWIWVDNSLLQKELVGVGYAKVKYIYGTYAYTNMLYDAQDQAKDAKIGLWSDYMPVTYVVTFDEDGKTTTQKINEYETAKTYTPTKEGYTFKGWYLNKSLYDFNTKITSNITLKAKYEKEESHLDAIIIILIIILSLLFNKKRSNKKI